VASRQASVPVAYVDLGQQVASMPLSADFSAVSTDRL